MSRCDSYYVGECTRGACELASWVGDWWGDAKDWAASAARGGLALTGVPTIGAVVDYGAGGGYSPYGHVGLVTDVYTDGTFNVREMNYVGHGVWDDRRSNTYGVAAFILPPGVSPGQGGPPPLGRGAGGPEGGGFDDLQNAWSRVQQLVGSHWSAQAGYLYALGGWIDRT